MPCYRNGRCRRGELSRAPWITAFEQGNGEGAIEAIACADSVDCIDRKGGDQFSVVFGNGDESSIAAAFEHDASRSLGEKLPRGVFGGDVVANEEGGLGFVWS